ncbi:4Fe-4S binding protein [Parabacteroides bouchesdurhonensis]|uniref:4Fe-4S binding protein n=1 Tax=Parabacteroides bouchesdurhonensis TaxID=1936995 RepID=UPI000E51F2AA|nr:4Fe-4S binding protein [Parabacteroides bouchesdurhonensis]RHJ91391.1 4Fe-4S dicluster domain-containing protein [Bacteroides sp. AM07-16]
MKRYNYLKGLRVFLAILFFVPILLFFVDFAGVLPNGVHALLHIQLMPALLCGAAGIIIFQIVLALLFGRIYCSVICPAGVLQDVINRLFCIGKKKKKGIRRFKYHKAANVLRYSLLVITVVLGIFGFMGLAMLLDPYSNFGRIATNLFRPVVMWGNNILADLLMKMDNYSLYHVTVSTVTASGLIAAIAALLVFIILVIFRGRLFCNTLCPVGALLSLVSRYSFFRISFDKDACTHCGNCEHTCKAEAINSKDLTVDTSRCVDCFNCISSCAKGGLQYRFKPFNKKEETTVDTIQATGKDNISYSANSRRTFLATTATVAVSMPIVSVLADEVRQGKGHRERKRNRNCNREQWPPITPPGSISLERFKDKCTACHICVVRCPSQVLRPAGLEYGFDYMLKPRLAYVSSYCNYECTVCADVCPTRAIIPLTKEEKATTQVGIATFFINRCIVKTEGTDCGACSEHCPTQAVHMVPYEGTLTIPSIDPDLCIGCGGCESICPVRPMRAIIIKANTEHKFVEKPKEEEVKKVEVDDFGF